MPYGEGSDAELEQRQQAARKHGAYSFQDRGKAALEKPQRSRLQEIKDHVQDRDGTLELMKENAANAMMITEMVLSHISRQAKTGVQLEKIGGLRQLPAFMNTAQRALRDLMNLLPDNQDVLDATAVLEAMRDGQED